MKDKKNIFIIIAVAVFVLAVAGAGIYYAQVVHKERKALEQYERGFELYKEGKYVEAEEVLSNVKDFEGVDQILDDIYYQMGKNAFESGQYEQAKAYFSKKPEYQNCLDYIKESNYLLGITAFENEDYETAETLLMENPDYKDTRSYLDNITYEKVKVYFNANDYENAAKNVLKILSYKGVEPYGIVVLQNQAEKAFENLEYKQALEMYERGLEFKTWYLEEYKGLTDEKKEKEYAFIYGDTSFEDRIKKMEEDYEWAKKESYVVDDLKNLVNLYETEKKDLAVLSQVDEIKVAMQQYNEKTQLPLIMISYKESINEGKKEKKQQAYAVYNEDEFYAICHSLKLEEIDKTNSDEIQANIKLSKYWEDEETVLVDMTRVRKAMGWE